MLNFINPWKQSTASARCTIGSFSRWSIEVLPRTAAKIDDFKILLPENTRVYIAHIAGTPIEDMVNTAKRLSNDGYTVMPHFPARNIPDHAALENLISRYRNEAGVNEGLILGGGETSPVGAFHSSIQLLETGLFDKYGFTRLHIAGHPEGSKDIDKDGSTQAVDAALAWKNAFANGTGAEMAIVTQFGFDPKVVTDWAERIQNFGITLPIHVGVAGPAKLQTLIKFAISCGVGPSLKILQKRALDISRLLTPYEPTEFISALSDYKQRNPSSLIEQIHLFPLGGIEAGAEWMNLNLR